MNKEYIEREATKTEIAIYFDTLIYEKPEGIEPNLNNIKFALLDLIDYNTVAADVAPIVHGEWIHKNGEMYCSVCGSEALMDEVYYKSPYCPDCGAKMKED